MTFDQCQRLICAAGRPAATHVARMCGIWRRVCDACAEAARAQDFTVRPLPPK